MFGPTGKPSSALILHRLVSCAEEITEDVWQLRAPVDELVLVGQRGGERDELDLVTAEALRLGGHVVELLAQVERNHAVVLGVEDQHRTGDVIHVLIAGEADVVGCYGVQEEPIEAGQVPVHHGEGVAPRLLPDVGERRL